MTNFEKYREEILKISERGNSFAVPRQTRVPMECDYVSCRDCLFVSSHCQFEKIIWLYEEAVEPAPTLTVKERGFCEIARSGCIARDKNGSLWVFDVTPSKVYSDATWWGSAGGRCKQLDGEAFPFITWESDKAWSIEELLRLEVEE